MRASTVFAVTIAVLLGLAVAVGVKVSGFLNGSGTPVNSVAKKPEIQILVAARNLFEGNVIDSNEVKIRPLRPDEMTHYEQYKDQYLPPVVQAASLRVVLKSMEADRPILKENLQALSKPDPLHLRLPPFMRAVNVAVPKDRSAGGLIQVGEWVDVFLTSRIDMPDCGKGGCPPSTKTATIARNVRVIVKRNTLWPVFSPLPEDRPVNFTLEANAYRAALVEFAKDKGNITLVPLPAAEQQVLESRRKEWLQSGAKLEGVSFADAKSDEYRDEDARVTHFSRGDLTVGEEDLVRIFNVLPPAPAIPPIRVERYSGVDHRDTVVFSDGETAARATPARRSFQAPASQPPVPSSIDQRLSRPRGRAANESGEAEGGGSGFRFSTPGSPLADATKARAGG